MMQDVTKTCKEAVINESTKNKKYSKNFEMYISGFIRKQLNSSGQGFVFRRRSNSLYGNLEFCSGISWSSMGHLIKKKKNSWQRILLLFFFFDF